MRITVTHSPRNDLGVSNSLFLVFCVFFLNKDLFSLIASHLKVKLAEEDILTRLLE